MTTTRPGSCHEEDRALATKLRYSSSPVIVRQDHTLANKLLADSAVDNFPRSSFVSLANCAAPIFARYQTTRRARFIRRVTMRPPSLQS